ncbi:MAG: glycosyltransferase [Opitutales bacterium]|nr:glycosyltransferase [Opitutales bacterium]
MSENLKFAGTPLVTVGIVTYNSAGTVLETLESAKAQTYPNLELIVSDDCSSDGTVALCRRWIEQNASRFVRTELLTVPANTGIPGNLNRVVAAARGTFLKSIAGDDILLPDCVADNMAFVREHPEAEIVFSSVREFCGNADKREFFETYPDAENRAYFAKSAREQFCAFVKSDFWVPAPACFVRTDLLRQNPYDENYPAMEDWPQWCRLTRAGTRLFFADRETVLYRVNAASVSTTKNDSFYSVRFMETRKMFFIRELRKYLQELGEQKQIRKYEREFLLFDFCIHVLKNRKNAWTSLVRHLFSRFLKICR